jgi:two-component system, OmpR family, sensor histidine kinase TctE
MTKFRFQSLQVRLAVRLAILYIVATAMAVGVLIYQAYDTAGTLHDRDLNLRAADLARYISADSGQGPHLDLPSSLAAVYQPGSSADIFALRSADGRIIAASPAGFGDVVRSWPAATDDASYFHLKQFGTEQQDYYGLSIALDSSAGPVSISIARAAGADVLIKSLLREFVLDLLWIIPLFVLATLVIGVFAIRGGLRPVRDASGMAAAVGPSTTSIRLPTDNLPSEIRPLVAAVNSAFDRLEQGFSMQREFTANAAHELRTPLTIITGALDSMRGNGELTKLKHDVARMNRLVEQLLRVARLDAVALDVSGTVDLNEIAAGAVAAMAPFALGQQRTIAFAGPGEPVRVRGNSHAIEDVIRNLIENAIAHAPPRTEVSVAVKRGGSVSVVDRGPGVPPDRREVIFERFWRGKGFASVGAGLGLAIVKGIVDAHGGSIQVDTAREGGAVFAISFPLADDGVHPQGAAASFAHRRAGLMLRSL